MTHFEQFLAFVFGIGPLIIFHELGHYVVARLCGVKVLSFSIGFGRILCSRTVGPDQTLWAVRMLPFGGYVKMLDDRDPATASASPADKGREFTSQSVWKRIAIIAAGPLTNFLIAIAVFTGLYMHGMPDYSTHLRHMAETTPVYQAGLREGDRVVAVNGQAVGNWSELYFEVLQAAIDKDALELDVQRRDGGSFSARIAPAAFEGMNLDKDVMGPLGLMVQEGPAGVGEVKPGGAAARGGLRVGDRIVAIDGRPMRDRGEVIKTVRASGGRTLAMGVQRGGDRLTLQVTPDVDAATNNVMMQAALTGSPEKVVVPSGALSAVAKGVRKTWDSAIVQFKMIGKIFTGAISWKNVTGPLTMADYAQQTARAGAIVFLAFIATVSISLGVMNLLPIPVLDGGLLLYYSVEVLTGRPLPEHVQGHIARLGVVMVVMLMTLALFNDVARRLI